MTEMNWKSFDYWKNLVGEGGRSLESPFNLMELTEKSLFLWSQMSAPMPSGATNGSWGIFPEPKALAGFLKHVVFPVFFETWLVREEWDGNPDSVISVNEILSKAESSDKCRYREDIPLMKNLIKTNYGFFNLPDGEVIKGLQDLTGKFNDRFEDTSTWSFQLKTFQSPLDVGKEIVSRIDDEFVEEELGLSSKAWLDTCGRVLKDKKAQDEFKRILAESALS
jgi:hypothetical protein